MTNNMHRAALAVLCVLAVVLGAGLFPATGFGANPVPGSGADGYGPGGEPAGDGTVETTTTASDGPRTTASDGPTTTASDGPRTTVDGGNGSTGDGAARTTTTRATTTTPADAVSEGGVRGAILGLLAVAVSVFVGFTAVAVGLGRHHRRRNPGQWDLPDAPHLRLLAYVRRVPQTSLSFVMFAGANAPDVLDALGSGVANVANGVGSTATTFGSALSTVGAAFVRVPAATLAGIGAFARALTALTLSLPSLSSATGAGGLFGTGGEDRPGSDPRAGGGPGPAPDGDPEPPTPPASVREAWGRLQEDVGVGGADGLTPGQVARRAISRGLPADAVRSLTRAFREVRYGGHPDDGERVSTAREAYERVRSGLDGDSS